MIEINLLPEKYRQPERTPIPILLGIVGGAALLLLVTLVYLKAAADVARLTADKQKKVLDLEDATRRAKEVEAIEREVQGAEERINTLFHISQSKIFWWRKLDQLVQVTPNDIWFDQIQVTAPNPAANPPVPAILALSCNSRTSDLSKVTRFLDILRENDNLIYHFEGAQTFATNKADPNVKFAPLQFKETDIREFQVRLPQKLIEEKKPAPPPPPQ